MSSSHILGSLQRNILTPLSFSRQFSATSSAPAGYKIRSHSGSKKRFKTVGDTFKRGKAGHAHRNTPKPASVKNKLSQTAYTTPTQTLKLRKVLLPYGA